MAITSIGGNCPVSITDYGGVDWRYLLLVSHVRRFPVDTRPSQPEHSLKYQGDRAKCTALTATLYLHRRSRV